MLSTDQYLALISPTQIAEAITPSDTTEHNGIQQLIVGTPGDVVLTFKNRNGTLFDVTFTTTSAGERLAYSPVLVKATGTTASDIIAFFVND